jgi:hypothetical protein
MMAETQRIQMMMRKMMMMMRKMMMMAEILLRIQLKKYYRSSRIIGIGLPINKLYYLDY